MTHTRLAAVSFLNTAPLVEGIDAAAGFELTAAVPSAIASLVRSGRADLGLASVIDAVRGPDDLAVLPGAGMIGSDGRTLTVRIFSRVPLDRVDALHADADSHTSAVLAQVVLHKRFGVRPRVVPFDAREHDPDGAWPDTVLLIGDKVVTASPLAVRAEHQLDLGQAWRDLTDLPFVYAVWMCLASRADDPRVRTAEALLDRQRRRNRARIDWVVTRAARARGWPDDLAREYAGSLLHYELGERERRAAELFCAWAHDLGLADRRVPRWADMGAG